MAATFSDCFDIGTTEAIGRAHREFYFIDAQTKHSNLDVVDFTDAQSTSGLRAPCSTFHCFPF